jgi:hypothetical protein
VGLTRAGDSGLLQVWGRADMTGEFVWPHSDGLSEEIRQLRLAAYRWLVDVMNGLISLSSYLIEMSLGSERSFNLRAS